MKWYWIKYKTWIKFKLWLIKKLGGFTEQEYLVHQVAVEPVTQPIETVYYETTVADHLKGYTNWHDQLLKNVAIEIGKAIIEKHMYTEYTLSPMPFDDMTRFRFCVKVVREPKDFGAELNMNKWGE